MNCRIQVKCLKKVEENGGFKMTVLLPPDVPGKDSLRCSASNALDYLTHDKDSAAEVKPGDNLCLALFTMDQKES